jgi:hypothetical protein
MNRTIQALLCGIALGVLGFIAPSCGKAPVGARCNASNCAGCCDETGTCLKGTAPEACGVSGALCLACPCTKVDATNEFGGRCVNGAGGGAAGGGTGGGSANACNASNCATGCCNAQGVCVTQAANDSCGTSGAACQMCAVSKTCVSGACVPCAGCIDINTGVCKSGTSDAQCGKAGSYCSSCNTAASQACLNQSCVGTGQCTAASCPTGCCENNVCIERAQFSTGRCGSGTAGGACVSCPGTQACEQATGTCSGGNPGTGGGGGLPGTCDPANGKSCESGKCCFQGFCVGNGTGALGGQACAPNGESCKVCFKVGGIGTTCNVTTGTCQ